MALIIRKNAPPCQRGREGRFCYGRGLRACNVDCARAFFALSDFKADAVASFELVKHYAVEVLGVKKEILCLAFACNESISTIRKSLDCTCHVVILCCVRNPTPFLSLVRLLTSLLHNALKVYKVAASVMNRFRRSDMPPLRVAQ